MTFLSIFGFSVLSVLLAYYLIVNLQWYNYSLWRVVFRHHKWQWHFFYFFAPLLAVLIIAFLPKNSIFLCIFTLLIYTPFLFFWVRKLDKKLVFTARVKRYFCIIIFFIILASISYYYLSLLDSIDSNILYFYGVLIYILAIFLGLFSSKICEKILFKAYENKAKNKLKSLKNLTIIAITGSYGKTSMKNFIAHILSQKYEVYSTPRSVNTFKGLVDDINKNLSENHRIYVAEAGARSLGDIKEIARLLNPHYAVIGKIGNAHIEYFKSVENTLKAKLELLDSKCLIKAFLHKDNAKNRDLRNYVSSEFSANIDKITLYPPEIKYTLSNLNGIEFSMLLDGEWVDFRANILGRFNVENIAVSVLLGHSLGLDSNMLQKAVASLSPVAHRLQKIESSGKIILDDSFNGNLDGMQEAIRLSSLHNGRKVIVTPGLVEQDKASNVALAQAIDDVFDLVIITGALNAELLDKHIMKASKIVLKDKALMQEILAQNLQNGDLVLFANDAPNYV